MKHQVQYTIALNSCIGKPSIKRKRLNDMRVPDGKHFKQFSLTSETELQVVIIYESSFWKNHKGQMVGTRKR